MLKSVQTNSCVLFFLFQLKLRKSIKQEDDRVVASIAFHPSGDYFATASSSSKNDSGHMVELWTMAGDSVFAAEQNDWVESLVFTPDGDSLILAGLSQNISFLDLTGASLKSWEINSRYITHIQLSPDNQILVLADSDGLASLWTLSGENILTVDHGTPVWRVLLTPDNKRLATAGESTVKFWDLTGNLLETIPLYNDSLYRMDFSPDGQQFVIADNSQIARLWSPQNQVMERATEVWQMDLENLLDYACESVSDYLSFNVNVTDGDRLLCDLDES